VSNPLEGIVPWNVTLVRLQAAKACFPMLATLLGMVMLARPKQPAKASAPMLVTPFPMVTLARLVQLAKAAFPMLVTLFPTVLQFSNAFS